MNNVGVFFVFQSQKFSRNTNSLVGSPNSHAELDSIAVPNNFCW